MSNEYTPLSERTSSYEPTKGPWGRVSDLVMLASKKGSLDELGISFLNRTLIALAKEAHDKAITEGRTDTEQIIKEMLKPFEPFEPYTTPEIQKEAGKQKTHDVTEKQDTTQTIREEDLVRRRKMSPEQLQQFLKHKEKTELTRKEKQDRRKGKHQQRQKNQLRDLYK